MLDVRDVTANQPPDSAGAVLFRSQIEIGQILASLAAQSTTLWAFMQDERLFLTRLLDADPDGEYIVVGYAPERHANDALLATGACTFHANTTGTSLQFFVNGAVETVSLGVAAIRMSYPTALVRGQRREHRRLRLASTGVSLRCVADGTGTMPFDAEINDISLGGMGTLLYDAQIRLAEGNVLEGCKIVHPRGDAIVADLEVMHVGARSLRDGRSSQRAGFRFLQRPKGIEKFMALFVLPL